MFDPRQILISPFVYNIDPSTVALLSSAPAQQSGGGKISLSSSFRISDILESPDEKANTSEEHDTSSICEDERSPSAESRPTVSPQSSVGGGKKARKARTIFTDKQLQELETTFEKQKYLSVQDRMDLAQRMGLSDTQVKTWYQNRRTKWKRQAAVGMDLLNEASNVAAVQQLLRTNPYWANYMAGNAMMPTRLPSFQGNPPFSLGFHPPIPGVAPFAPLQTVSANTPASTSPVTSSNLAATVPTGTLSIPAYPFHIRPSSFTLNFAAANLTEQSTVVVTSTDEKSETK